MLTFLYYFNFENKFDKVISHFNFLVALLLKQSATYLVCLACVCRMVYVETPPPPRNGISTGNFLISSMALEAAKKFWTKLKLFLKKFS